MAEKRFKKGDVVKVTTKNNVFVGIIKHHYYGSPLVDLLREESDRVETNRRVEISQVEQVEELNVFDMLREKGIIT